MRIHLAMASLLALVACEDPSPGLFSSDPTATPVQSGQIDEASGLVDSRSQPGNLWVNQDSGSPAELVLLGHDGNVKGRVAIPDASNRDWEELASGPGPQEGVNYLYVGEIGDNNAQHPACVIYRLPEPANLQTPVTQVERINFKYPDGPRDAEAMFVDPRTRDIWIISKWESNVRLYRLPYPQNINEVSTAEAYGELPYTTVTGAAISPDGSEILLRTYTQLHYWKRQGGQSIADALQKGASRQLATRFEPQGEAVCFDRNGSGFYTLSERRNASEVNLYYYPR